MVVRYIGKILTLVFLIVANASSGETQTLPYNSDPDAFQAGILFHDAVPMEMRKTILEDLIWLHQLGKLEGAESLGRFLGKSKDEGVSGADIVHFIVRTVRLMNSLDACIDNQILLINPFVQLAIPLPSRGRVRLKAICQNRLTKKVVGVRHASVNIRSVMNDFFADHFTLAVKFGNQVVPILDGYDEFVSLSPQFLSEEGNTPLAGRIERLGTLLHEGAHIAMRGHLPCPSSQTNLYAYLSPEVFAYDKNLDLTDDACTVGLTDPYLVEALFYSAIFSWCGVPASTDMLTHTNNCKSAEIGDLVFHPLSSSSRILFEANDNLKGKLLEITERFRDTVLRVPSADMKAVKYFPHQVFFQTLRNIAYFQLSACKHKAGCVRSVVISAALRIQYASLMLDAYENRFEEVKWPALPKRKGPAFPTSEVDRWIAAIAKNGPTGENLPMAYAIPCQQLHGAC